MNHFITLTQAVQMTETFRQHREAILTPSAKNQNLLPLSETFDRAAFEALLAQPGATGVRLYYGMDEELKLHGIFVAVDEANRDILGSSLLLGSATAAEEPGSTIVEVGKRCPEDCPPPSPLNP